jgi:hypothetical protein
VRDVATTDRAADGSDDASDRRTGWSENGPHESTGFGPTKAAGSGRTRVKRDVGDGPLRRGLVVDQEGSFPHGRQEHGHDGEVKAVSVGEVETAGHVVTRILDAVKGVGGLFTDRVALEHEFMSGPCGKFLKTRSDAVVQPVGDRFQEPDIVECAECIDHVSKSVGLRHIEKVQHDLLAGGCTQQDVLVVEELGESAQDRGLILIRGWQCRHGHWESTRVLLGAS